MAKVGWSAGIDYVSGALSKPRAVKAREEDLSKVDADQAAFIAQKDQAGGKRTMKAYLWSLECKAYDETHPRN